MRDKWPVFLLLILSVITVFIFNNSIGLWDQDEAAYAGFALRMNETGNYLIPDFPWSGIHRKPPLHFWFNAFWFEVFGAGEFATRFSSGLSILGTIGLIWFLGKRIFGNSIAQMAAIIGSGSLLIFGLAKIAVTDADLLFFETLTALSILGFIQNKKIWWTVLVFIGVSGGALVKGPPVFIVALGMLGILGLFKAYRLQAILTLIPVLLGFLPLYIWGYLTWQQDQGEFVLWLIDWYILKRDKPFATQTGPPGYFLGIFIVGFFSLVNFLFHGLKPVLLSSIKRRFQTPENIFLLSWILPGWFFYEIMPSKLPSYAIGAFGAVCTIIALGIKAFQSGKIKRPAFTFSLVLSIIIYIGLVFAGVYLTEGWATGLVILGAVLLSVLCYFQFKQSKNWIVFASFQPLIVAFLGFTLIVPGLEEKRSAAKLVVEEIHQNYPDQKVVVTELIKLPSFLFYLEQKHIPYQLDYEDAHLAQYLMEGNVLVMFEHQLETLENLQSTFNNNLNVQSYEGWLMDQGKSITYYVVAKLEP